MRKTHVYKDGQWCLMHTYAVDCITPTQVTYYMWGPLLKQMTKETMNDV